MKAFEDVHEKLFCEWQAQSTYSSLNKNDGFVIEGTQSLNQLNLDELKSIYSKYNFFVVRVKNQLSIDEVADFFSSMNTNEAIVPNYYANSKIKYHQGFNKIKHSKRISHAGFSSGSGQLIHVDGTLFEVGAIRTSVLFCESQASEGGNSIVVQTCRAYLDALFTGNLDIKFLMENDCLKRTAVDFDQASISAPAFSHDGLELLTRYSVDNTSKWVGLTTKQKNHLKIFEEKFLSNPVYNFSFLLENNDILVMRNSKISHGRTFFSDSKKQTRIMHRGLFATELFSC